MTWTIALLKRYWPAIVVTLALLGVWLWHVGEIKEADRAGYDRAHQEMQAQLERERQHWRELREEIDRERYEEKSALERRINRIIAARAGAIRMCEPTDQVRDPGGAGEPDGAGDSGRQTYRAGEDLRPRLVLYGAGCEALRQEIAAWEAWYRSIRK